MPIDNYETSKAIQYLEWRDGSTHNKSKDFVAQNINSVVNQDGYNDPICFSTYVVAKEGMIPELLKEMGLSCGAKNNETCIDTSKWLIKEGEHTSDGKRKVEIISPFMSQNKAMEELPKLLDCMEENGATINFNLSRVLSSKMVIPSQDTMDLEQIKSVVGTDEKGDPDFSELLKEANQNFVNEDDIAQKYSNNEAINYTFSGAVGSDPHTCPTSRDGMYGGKYASPNIHTAVGYASKFLHIYTPSSQNVYGNFGWEDNRAPLVLPDKDGKFPEEGKHHIPVFNRKETTLIVKSMEHGGINEGKSSGTPNTEQEVRKEDLCVATYFAVRPAVFYKIPENDIKWKAFKDYYKLRILPDTENNFEKRHLNLLDEQKINGLVTTYDNQWSITPVMLNDKNKDKTDTIEPPLIQITEPDKSQENTAQTSAPIANKRIVDIEGQNVSLPNTQKGLKALVGLKRGISRVTNKYLKKITPEHNPEKSDSNIAESIITNHNQWEK